MQKYGQHFLINESVITQIVDAALLLRAENLVEIGPGKGALTHALAARGQRDFLAVEIDPEMALLFGNEALGISPDALAAADGFVSLPMLGSKASINVGNCAAVVLYAVLRKSREVKS